MQSILLNEIRFSSFIKLLVAFLFIFFSHTVMAKQPDKGELMTNYLQKNGTCSLDKSDWCPMYYKETGNGFTLYGKTKNSLRIINLNYDNLSAVCVLWKSAVEVVGGNPKATANLLITDKNGDYVMMTRECK